MENKVVMEKMNEWMYADADADADVMVWTCSEDERFWLVFTGVPLQSGLDMEPGLLYRNNKYKESFTCESCSSTSQKARGIAGCEFFPSAYQ